MKGVRRNWLLFATCSVFAAAPALNGCDGTKTTKTDASGSTAPDGRGPSSDAIIPDTPMGAGGSGGGVGYDGPASWGGSGGAPLGGTTGTSSGGAAGSDANTGVRDSALGGAGGALTGGGSGGRGGDGGVVGGGSGGAPGAGGAGRTGGAPGMGGAITDGDASTSPPLDGGDDLPICGFPAKHTPEGIPCEQLVTSFGFTGRCRDAESPAVCACDPSGGIHCSRQCPAAPTPGGACSSEGDDCYYDSIGLCRCAQIRAADGTYSYAYSCPVPKPDAAPDGPKPITKVVPCAEEPTFDPTFSNCTGLDAGTSATLFCGECRKPAGVSTYLCALEDGRSFCTCTGTSWACWPSACPADPHESDPCDQARMYCMNSQGEVCACTVTYGFSCSLPDN